MRGSHHVAFQRVLEDLGVPALDAGGHCATHIRIRLVAVEAAELDHTSVQFKAALGKGCGAEADFAGVLIEIRISQAQGDTNFVESWLVQIPG